jgi:hypothetical protein
MKLKIEEVKNIVEIIAILFIGFYFLFQVMVGSFIVSMEVTPSIKQFDIKGKKGFIVSLYLKRGNYGSINLHSIHYTVKDAINNKVIKGIEPFTGLTKYNTNTKTKINAYIRLSPGDKKTFSEAFFLDYTNPIKIDFLIIAKRDKAINDAQWLVNAVYAKK